MKKSKLPKTDSIQKLAEFWDTHDTTNFEDELEEVKEPVFVPKPLRNAPFHIRSPRLVHREDASYLRKQVTELPKE